MLQVLLTLAPSYSKPGFSIFGGLVLVLDLYTLVFDPKSHMFSNHWICCGINYLSICDQELFETFTMLDF